MQIKVLKESVSPRYVLPMEKTAVVSSCPVCDNADRQMLLCQVRDSLEFSWCKACSHMYLSRRPSQQWYLEYYKVDWDKNQRLAPAKNLALYYSAKRKLSSLVDLVTNRKETIADEIRRSIPNFCSPVLNKGDKVLDVGCGYGFTLATFKDLGYRPYGIESSIHRAQYALANGIPCRNVPVEELNRNTFGTGFQIVISNHVLEHVYDPREFMAAIAKVVDADGHVCITVPNFYKDFLFESFNAPMHIHCFTPKSLSTLLKRFGFHVRKMSVDHQIRILAQKKEVPDVYPFTGEDFSEEELAPIVVRNTLPGVSANGQEKKYFLVSWGVKNRANFNFSRILDDVYETQVKEIPAAEVERYQSSIQEGNKEKMICLCEVSTSGPALPIRFDFPHAPANSFWNGEFYAY